MQLKIFTIGLAHNSEYELPGVTEIVAVDFFAADVVNANLATGGVVRRSKPQASLICRME